MRVNHDSPVPLYYQLREQIRNNILSGKWSYGKELPAEMQLCETLSLSRATVKQAMDGLVQEGLIERKKGKGTFVTYRNEGTNIFAEPSLTKQLEESGLEIYSRVLLAKEDVLEQDICGYFDDPGKKRFCKIRRVRYVSNKPVAIEENYIQPEWSHKILEQNLNKSSVYEYLRQANGFEFDSYHISVHPVLFTEEDKQLLGLEDDRVQLIVFKKDLVGMRLDITSYYKGQKIMLNRRLFNGTNFSISVDYNAGTRQFSIESSKLTIPNSGR
ncbi:GntR family transcriptional regulator [Dysosmobacter sp.]